MKAPTSIIFMILTIVLFSCNSFRIVLRKRHTVPTPTVQNRPIHFSSQILDRTICLTSCSKLSFSNEEELTGLSEKVNEAVGLRKVDRIEKYPRLPVWPVWSGVLYFILDRLQLGSLSRFLEDKFGGRVCPMMLDAYRTDPFILMVYHRHSFSLGDPIRYLSRLLLPEGFPAHPHRGFETVTYVIQGSMTHRDSIGVKQSYGNSAVQWLTAGKGILHEEMWNIPQSLNTTHIELYQIWVNLPGAQKMSQPKIQLFGQEGNKALPVVKENGATVRIIAGEFGGVKSEADSATDLAILHVSLEPGSVWTHRLSNVHRTCFLYAQKGDLEIVEDHDKSSKCPAHYTAFLSMHGDALKVKNVESFPADFILLTGEPIGEPIVAKGSMVMNTDSQINEAYQDFYQGIFGPVWDHTLSDEKWKLLVENAATNNT